MTATAEKNLIDVPLYTALDVAHYLRAPVWFFLQMRPGWDPDDLHHWRHWLRFLEKDGVLYEFPGGRERWSFRQVADLYVRHFAVETLIEHVRRYHLEGRRRVDPLLEAAWITIRNYSGTRIFSADGISLHDGIKRLISQVGTTLSEEERTVLEKKLLMVLTRFDMDGANPVRLYPFSRTPPQEGTPRVVVMDPAIRFGRPTVAEHGTPTDILFERHQAGDSLLDLADDYGLSVQKVEEAIRFEAKPMPLYPYFWL